MNWITDSNEKRGTYKEDLKTIDRTNYEWLDPENKSLREVLKEELQDLWFASQGLD